MIDERLHQLCRASLAALPQMVDESTHLFSQKSILTPDGLKNIGVNVRYSAVSVVGLLSYDWQQASRCLPSVTRTLDTLVSHGQSTTDGSTAGAVLWALSLAKDPRVPDFFHKTVTTINPRDCTSMDLGLLLAGLCCAFQRYPAIIDKIRKHLETCAAELCLRFCPEARLFREHQSAPALRACLTSRMTSFASQVYPVHGLALMALTLNRPVPPILKDVAERLVLTQGPQGQWWWIYSSATGGVLEGYPVYSVHQDAMAFMPLLLLEKCGAGSFRAPLQRGLDWIFGANELGTPLFVPEQNFIARCIQRIGSTPDGAAGMNPRSRRYAMIKSWLKPASEQKPVAPSQLEVLREYRSYHLGWVLYVGSLLK